MTMVLHNMVFLTSKHWFPQKLTKLPEHSNEQIQQQNVAEQDVEPHENRHHVATDRSGASWERTVAIEERVIGTAWLLHYKGETSKSQNKSNTIYRYTQRSINFVHDLYLPLSPPCQWVNLRLGE